MSILIKGMAMPKCCDECSFYDGDTYGICNVVGLIMLRGGKYSHCPLIEVPPHGRLIDADVLSQMFDSDESFGAAVLDIIADTPTIIESEE